MAANPGSSGTGLAGFPLQLTGQMLGMNPQQQQQQQAQFQQQLQQQQQQQMQPQSQHQQAINHGGFNATQAFNGLDARTLQSLAAMQTGSGQQQVTQQQQQQQPRVFGGQIQSGAQALPQQMLGWAPNQNQQQRQQHQQQQQQSQAQQLPQNASQQNSFFAQMAAAGQAAQQLPNMMAPQVASQSQPQPNALAMSNPQLFLQMQAAAMGMQSQQQQQQARLQSSQQLPQQHPAQPQQQQQQPGPALSFNNNPVANAALAALTQQGFNSAHLQQLMAGVFSQQNQQTHQQQHPFPTAQGQSMGGQNGMQLQGFGSPQRDAQQAQLQHASSNAQTPQLQNLNPNMPNPAMFGGGLLTPSGQVGRGPGQPGFQQHPTQQGQGGLGQQMQQQLQAQAQYGQIQTPGAYGNAVGMGNLATGGMSGTGDFAKSPMPGASGSNISASTVPNAQNAAVMQNFHGQPNGLQSDTTNNLTGFAQQQQQPQNMSNNQAQSSSSHLFNPQQSQGQVRPGTAGSTPRLSAQGIPVGSTATNGGPGTPSAQTSDTPAPKGRKKKGPTKAAAAANSAGGPATTTPVLAHTSVDSPASLTQAGTPAAVPSHLQGSAFFSAPDRPRSRTRDPSLGPGPHNSATPRLGAAQIGQSSAPSLGSVSQAQNGSGGQPVHQAQTQQYPHTFGSSLSQGGQTPQLQPPMPSQQPSQAPLSGPQMAQFNGMGQAPPHMQHMTDGTASAAGGMGAQGGVEAQQTGQFGSKFPPGIGPNWTSSVPLAQQQMLSSRAWQVARETGGNAGQILGQYGYVWIRADQVPNPSVNATISATGPVPGPPGVAPMLGAIVKLDEARALGALPQIPPAPQTPAPGAMIVGGMPAGMASSAPGAVPGPSSLPHANQAQIQQPLRPPSQQDLSSLSASAQVSKLMAPQIGQPPANTPMMISEVDQNAVNRAKGGPQMPGPHAGAEGVGQQSMSGLIPPSSSAGTSGPGMLDSNGTAELQQSSDRPQGLSVGAGPAGAGLPGVDAPRAMGEADRSAQMPNAVQQNAAAAVPPVFGGPLPPVSNLKTHITGFNTRMGPLPPPGQGATSTFYTPLTPADIKEMERIMMIDHEYQERFAKQQDWSKAELRNLMDEVLGFAQISNADSNQGQVVPKLQWWESGDVNLEIAKAKRLFKLPPEQTEMHFEPFRIIYPKQRDVEASRGARGSRPSLHFSKKDLERVAATEERLVPIRIEIDHDQYKLREAFTWNANDATLSVQAFAINICEDYGMPPETFSSLIAESIDSQLAEFRDVESARTRSRATSLGTDGKGKLAENEKWWSAWRHHIKAEREQDLCATRASTKNPNKRIRSQSHDEAEEGARRKLRLSRGSDSNDDTGIPIKQESVEDAMMSEVPVETSIPAEELRTIIKLDITVGNMNLLDQFEWDVADADSSPERFAEVFTADLGLSGEFKTAVAHQIREQVTVFLKSLAMIGHPFNGAPIPDEELRSAFLPVVDSCERLDSQIDLYTPKLLQLSEAEIDKLTKERERDARRKRRQTKGRRGIQLPDREPNKTQRSPLVYGLMANTAAITSRDSTLPAHGLGAFSGLSTRRAAALAASQSFSSGLHVDPIAPSLISNEVSVKLNQKRVRSINPDIVHQSYPGGLGRKQEADAPLFAPSAPLKSPTSSKANLEPVEKKNPVGRPKGVPARPPEFAHLQPNLIDGMWHCSNCGVPGSLGPGRRKGPLGDKSLCSICGKHYHRFRKVPEVEYSRDEHFHLQLQRSRAAAAAGAEGKAPAEEDNTRTGLGIQDSNAAKAEVDSGKAKSALEGLPFQEVGSPEDSDSEESEIESRHNSPTKRTLLKGGVDGHDSRQDAASPNRNVNASPLGKTSTLASELSGAGPASIVPVTPALSTTSVMTSTTANGTVIGTPGGSVHPVARALSPGTMAKMPDWIKEVVEAKRATVPYDRFEIQIRPRAAGTPAPAEPEWRVRCLDCPGRLYTLGPGKTLDNFDIHLKNRAHRANVQMRVDAAASAAADGASLPAADDIIGGQAMMGEPAAVDGANASVAQGGSVDD